MADDTRSRVTCGVPVCRKRIRSPHLMCMEHWRQLPQEEQWALVRAVQAKDAVKAKGIMRDAGSYFRELERARAQK